MAKLTPTKARRIRFFLDTNILVYCFDPDSPAKQQIARDLVYEAVQSGRGFVSWQVAQEFLSLATKKFASRMDADQARRILDDLLDPLCEVYPGLATMQGALEAECQKLYSEDFQNGFQLGTLVVQNPFQSMLKNTLNPRSHFCAWAKRRPKYSVNLMPWSPPVPKKPFLSLPPCSHN
ncbi:MAG TPA: PIN domain-containing protein [Fibrobacteraceae bacterium]|nr:PIN domain-containing protein [Fibrobacteraceae bacterium]